MYIVVSILDCNYSPREPMGRDSAAQTFYGRHVSTRPRNFITCLYDDSEGSTCTKL